MLAMLYYAALVMVVLLLRRLSCLPGSTWLRDVTDDPGLSEFLCHNSRGLTFAHLLHHSSAQ